MKEYIEREAVLAYPIRKDHYDREHGNEHFIFGIESVIEFVENLPAADVAPVVRCRECIHRDGTPGQPNILCGQMHDDDFCSYGQRKEDDHD